VVRGEVAHRPVEVNPHVKKPVWHDLLYGLFSCILLFVHTLNMNLIKFDIAPVTVKTFDQTGTVRETVSHYVGFIHGVAHLGIKNFYMSDSRREMIDQMFATLNAHNVKLV
jgi:hypothetical protein